MLPAARVVSAYEQCSTRTCQTLQASKCRTAVCSPLRTGFQLIDGRLEADMQELRDLIAKWGGEMTYAQKTKTWNITKDGEIAARLSNDYITEFLYQEGATCRASGMKPAYIVADYLENWGINFHEITTASNLSLPTTTRNDEGMCMGITTQITDYLAERQDELA